MATRRGKNPAHRESVRFKDREAFGEFCVALTGDHIPFGLVGFKTVVLTQSLKVLPTKSHKLFEQYKVAGRIDVSPTLTGGKRRLPTPKEAEKLFGELAKGFCL